jgi:hypothetical protein
MTEMDWVAGAHFGLDERSEKVMKRFTAVALDTYQYDEYPRPNWIRGQQYEATDDGHTLTLSSETGNFYFAGKARDEIREMFRFEEAIENA